MFILISFSTYSEYKSAKYESLLNAKNNYIYSFEIPKNENDNPQNLEYLKKSAKENNVNFLREVSYYNDETEETYTESYLYLSTNTDLFNHIPISKGKLLYPDDMNKDVFLSTKETKSKKQVGTIEDFGGGHNFSIHSINNLIEQQSLSGKYKAECNDDESFNQFLESYINYVDKDNSHNEEEFIKSSVDTTYINTESANTSLLIFAFCIVLLVLTCVYYFVSQTKAISVMKLNGYSISEIKHKIFIDFYFCCSLCINVLIIIVSILAIHDITKDFLLKVILVNGISFVLSYLIINGICTLYIKHTQINYCIKGKKPLGAIIIFDLCFKVVISIIIVIIGGSLLVKLDDVRTKQENLKNWKVASNYGVFYPVRTGDETDDLRAGNYTLDLPTYKFYIDYLEPKLKSVYVNSSEYTKENISDTAGEDDYIRNMYVNTNYLDLFPVYDEHGNKIEISDSEENSIFLVPEKYKSMEKELLEYFSDVRTGAYKLHTEEYNQTGNKNTAKVKIIYTKNNQDVFSFNIDVFAENGNNITDPIIMVMTKANTLVPDVNYQSSSNMTLFIPLVNMDAKVTYSNIENKLNEYNLDDNFPYLVKTNDYILKSISEIESELTVLETILSIVTIMLVIVITQFIYLLFQKNKFEMFLKKSLGYSYLQKYGKIYSILILFNFMEFIVSFIFGVQFIVLIFVLKLLFETLLATALIIYFEKKNVVTVLKEGV